METISQSILDLTVPQLQELFRSLDEPSYRVGQVLSWIYKKLAISFEEMTDLPQSLRQKLTSAIAISTLTPVKETISGDRQTRKTLFRLNDGKTIESSLMMYAGSDSRQERHTVCVSTQVGCNICCAFCATGQQGFERNLRAGEIIEQVLHFMRQQKNSNDPDRRVVTNVVFMGMGEPLANYEAVMQAITMLNSKDGLGLGMRQITLSTAGLVPQIQRLSRESLHVELAVSFHAPTNDLRNRLVPLNRKYPLESLIQACREYFARTGRRPTFEYALFQGVNDSLKQAQDLALLLRGLNCHVNLIVGNPTASKGFHPSSRQQAFAFQGVLKDRGIPCTIRLPRGTDIEAGCGQLRSRWLENKTSAPA